MPRMTKHIPISWMHMDAIDEINKRFQDGGARTVLTSSAIEMLRYNIETNKLESAS